MGPVSGQQVKLDQALASLRELDQHIALLEMCERALYGDDGAQLALRIVRCRLQGLLDDTISAVQAAGWRE